LATSVYELVVRRGPDGEPQLRSIFAHGDNRGTGWLGKIWVCTHAGISMGNLLATAKCGTRGEFWNAQRRPRLAGSSGGIPVDAEARNRSPGRYGARFRGAAAHAGDVLSLLVCPTKYFSGDRGRR